MVSYGPTRWFSCTFMFIWIVLLPMATFALQFASIRDQCLEVREPICWNWSSSKYGCVDGYVCSKDAALQSLLPGLLNFVPLLFLFSQDRIVRMAALITGNLGLIRFIVPVLFYVSYDSPVEFGYPRILHPDASLIASALLWLLSFGAMGVFMTRWRKDGHFDRL